MWKTVAVWVCIAAALALFGVGVFFLTGWILGLISDRNIAFIVPDENYVFLPAEGDGDYYYNCLTEEQKALYESLHRTAEQYAAGEKQPETESSKGREEYVLGHFRYKDYGLSKNEAQSAVVAFANDCPSYFFCSRVNIIYNNRWVAPIVAEEFAEHAAVAAMREKIDAGDAKVEALLEGEEEEAARFAAIYECVLASTGYAYGEGGEAVFDGYTCSIAGVLDGDENTGSICQGYGRSVLYLCNLFDIDCLYVTSKAINHAWNVAQIGGAWYYADATNDDSLFADAWENTKYGLCSESEFWALFGREEPAFDTPEDGIDWLGELPPLSQENYGVCEAGGATYRLWGNFREYYVQSAENAARVEIPAKVNGLPVTKLYEGTFRDCPDAEEIVVPGSVTQMDAYLFRPCRKLEKLTVPFMNGSLKELFGYTGDIPETLAEVTVTGGAALGRSAFEDAASLRRVVLPDGMTEIAEYAFGNSGVECVVLPKELEYVGFFAFEGCENLQAVYYKGSPADWENIRIHSPSTNGPLLNAARYYYSEKTPPDDGNAYWHCGESGEIVIWQ